MAYKNGSELCVGDLQSILHSMSGFINTPIARAPRQSGLKKPRPLRSVSLQEGQNFKRERPDRQISSDYPSNTVRDDKHFITGGCGDGFQSLVLENCDGRTDSSGSLASSQDAFSPTGFHRQSSVTSQDSYSSSWGHSRKSSTETNQQPFVHSSTNTTPKQNDSFVDANDNKVESPKSDSESPSITSLHKRQYKTQSGSPEDKNETRQNVTLATLRTTKGKQLVLSGTCIQTILNACRILLHDMGASIIRLETVENPNVKAKDIAPESPSESSSTVKSRMQYSKEELLAMSESDLSRKPPAMWNILAPTHADCCIPAAQLLEYFEKIDFHPHDGTLVVDEPKRRERRD